MGVTPQELSSSGHSEPAMYAIPITPANVDLAEFTRGIYVGTSGDIQVMMAANSAIVTFIGCLAGSVLPLRVRQIRVGTTAANLVAIY